MKNYIYKIIFTCLLLNIASVQYADLSGRNYNLKIKTIENMLDGSIPIDIEFVQSNLKLLRDNTTSFDRVKRINNAYQKFNRLLEERKRSAERQSPVRKVEFKDEPQIITIPARVPKGIPSKQRLKTLLLYAKSLLSTADVAIIVNQKDNAQSSLAQAAQAIDLMQKILREHPKLTEKYAPRIQSLHNHIAKTLEEVRLMQ